MPDRLDDSAKFNDKQGTRVGKQPTGAGAEAAEGIHGSPAHRDSKRDPSDKSSLTGKEGENIESQPGSEPIDSNSHEHVSGYGGAAGKAKPSSDGEQKRTR